jgi:ribosomal protein S18 acetylase RimI-like enzyme
VKIVKIEDPKEKSRICEKVLRALPLWFGIESAIIDYINDVQAMETWAVIENDVVGFLSLNKHNSKTAEIHVMGLLPEFHGKRIGNKLIQTAEESLASQGFQFLTVKTLSESRPNKEYDQTRRFYLRYGFTPLEEFKTLWGEANPCLMLVKVVSKNEH